MAFLNSLRNHLAYRRTVAELSSLDPRLAEDLGVDRGRIHEIAADAVYRR